MNLQTDTCQQLAGFIDGIDADRVWGWVTDRSRPFNPVELSVLVDGELLAHVTADQRRADVTSTGISAERVGFSFLLPRGLMDGQAHRLSFTRADGVPVQLDNAKALGRSEWEFCFERPAEATAESHRPDSEDAGSFEGNLDTIDADSVRGWAIIHGSSIPCHLYLIIDGGLPCASVICDTPRPDVFSAGYTREQVGFSVAVPDRFHDDMPHELEFCTASGAVVPMGDGSHHLRSRWAFRFPRRGFHGTVNGMGHGAINGWVFAFDRVVGMKTGGQDVLVTAAGQPVALLRADQFRPDVAEIYDCEPNCGFSFVPPPETVTGQVVTYRFTIVPAGVELQGSPLSVEFPDAGLRERLLAMLSTIDTVFTQAWHLKQQIKSLIPLEAYNLHNYHAWATRYQALIAEVFAPPAAQVPLPGGPDHVDLATLVSVICPTYRPRPKDFIAAVESVRAQTHRNWELIIVDDASGSPELETLIEDFCRTDPRIRKIMLKNNDGISNATNKGIAKARGAYVAFFDHDDLMVNAALELMLARARETGAEMLYCDEDKIDDSGTFSEPHFKAAWNHRLMLAVNYVCHLLFVRRDKLLEAGPLRSDYDGAQDHDLVLRLSEVIASEAIVHVPEVLYHWRKTPTSTAQSGATKTYAVDAGSRAIADHLARRGIKAVVEAPLRSTLYDVVWQFEQQPKVSIIIPYREQIEMTQHCIDQLLGQTDYKNYEIVLVDNFSTSPEATAFAQRYAHDQQVRILKVPEKFNYSRINNLAVAKTDSPFLLFLNNDVVVDQRDWLTILVGEALADSRVGIVGARLLYPNGFIQHGGVVLGVGGIADHAHHGLSRQDLGYMALAVSAHEVSAVTAAMLLCRREAFEAVGGFDEEHLQVAFNDVDLCLKVGQAGWRIIYAPRCVAEHGESMSRGSDMAPEKAARFFDENQRMTERWGELLDNDPFYPRAFSKRTGLYRDLEAPRLAFDSGASR